MKQDTRIKTEEKLKGVINEIVMAHVSDEMSDNFFTRLMLEVSKTLRFVYESNSEDMEMFKA